MLTHVNTRPQQEALITSSLDLKKMAYHHLKMVWNPCERTEDTETQAMLPALGATLHFMCPTIFCFFAFTNGIGYKIHVS